MGEHTHTCCCDHSEEALLKRIGELAAEYKGREGSLIIPLLCPSVRKKRMKQLFQFSGLLVSSIWISAS